MGLLDDAPGWTTAALAITGAIVTAGVANFLLSAAGYTGLGTLVWVAGYGGAVIAAWAVFFRGREFDPE